MSDTTKPKKILKEGHTELLVWNIPDELKVRFKIRCVEKKETMRDVIMRAMTDYTND